jgi:muconate cycloisomerase
MPPGRRFLAMARASRREEETASLNVVEITAYHVRIPLRRKIRHASHERKETENLVLRCTLEDGTEGFGEGVPRDYVTGETIDTTLGLLRKSDLAAQLKPFRDLAEAIDTAGKLRLPPVPGDERDCQGNAARCAVELSFLDACCRHFREPLSAVTRIAAADLYQPQGWVRYGAAITGARGRKLSLYSLILRLYRFAQVKVKVGIDGYDDAARLKSLRRFAGRNIDIRVDANEAWSPSEVVERIRELEPIGITGVEQPVAHADTPALAEIRKQIKVPIVLDESLCGRVDAEAAIALGTCDVFNLRLSKCGGFLPTLCLAQLAMRHGLRYQLGCQVGETAILSAAGRYFASSVRGIRYLEGSYDRYLVREDLCTRDITFGWGGWAPALEGAGLGIPIDLGALERVTIHKERLL